VVLALGERVIPQTLNVERINPALGLDGRLFEVATEGGSWEPAGPTRVAGVSSFGFGGANAHVIVEEAPPTAARPAGQDPPGHLLCLSGRSVASLQELAGAMSARLESPSGDDEVSDACFTANRSRTHQPCRAAIAASSPDGLRDLLRRLATGERARGVSVVDGRDRGAPRVAFMFTGQGSQAAGMGKQLHDTQPVFRAALDRCAEALSGHLDVPLHSVLFPAERDRGLIDQTRYTQPALVAFEWALAELWRSWGVTPGVVVGHSIGEYTAACVAGALAIEDALALVAARGRLMTELCPGGAMIAVLGDRDRVASALRAHNGAVSIAADNGPESVVLSGGAPTIADVRRELERDRIHVHPLTVSHAFHSPLLDPMLDELERAAAAVRATPARIPIASNLTGELMPAGVAPGARYWRDHTREPVRFAACVQALRAAGYDVFLEVGPRATLTAMARRLAAGEEAVTWTSSLRADQPEGAAMLAAAGELHAAGVRLDADGMDPHRRRRVVSLPASRYLRERHWFELPASSTHPEEPMPTGNGNSHRNGARSEIAWYTEIAAEAPPPVASRTVDAVVALFRDQTAAVLQLCGAVAGAGATSVEASEPALLPPGAIRLHSARAPAPEPSRQLPPLDPGAFVRAELSAVCGFPPHEIRGADRVADLGLDSLMVAELRRRLQPLVPHAEIADVVRVTAATTVGEVIIQLASAAGLPAPGPAMGSAARLVAPEPPRDHEHGRRRADPAGASLRPEDWPEFAAVDRLMASIEAGGGNPYARLHAARNAEATVVDGRRVTNYASFNYLGFSADPAVCQAAVDAIERYGTSASATPLLLGETPLHAELERELCDRLGCEAALLFASGHATNVTTVGHLLGADDLILHDELIHDSTVRGALLSGARRLSFPHNDHEALDATLTRLRSGFRRVLVSIEGVYSQDGDVPDLPAFIRVKQRHAALLMVDEAHSLGVIGATGGGIGEHFGVARSDVDVWMGTLSKALGSCGGYIAGSAGLVKLLKHSAPGYIFATSVSPPGAAAALAALRLLKMSPDRVARLQANARLFVGLARERGMDTGRTDGSAVIPILVGDLGRAIRISESLLARGINVMPIGYPAVPPDQARLRFFVNSTHSEEQIRHTIDALAEELAGRAPGGSAAAPEPPAGARNLRGRLQTALERFAHRAIEATHRSEQ